MREVTCEEISAAVALACREANTQLPEDIRCAVRLAAETEQSPVGRAILGDLMENFEFAAQKNLPICQDTGMALVFLELGQEVHITGGLLENAVNEGIRRGYLEGLLRCSVVRDPLRRENTGDNTPGVQYLRLTEGDKLTITVAPKGFGSENMTGLKMFNPSAAREDILAYLVECVSRAGSNPCPPVVVGVGLGGTADAAAVLAKRALLLRVDRNSSDPFYAALEREALERINALGVGPQGLGGSTTALSVRILSAPTHIAGLPCCVCLGCHVTRHATVTL